MHLDVVDGRRCMYSGGEFDWSAGRSLKDAASSRVLDPSWREMDEKNLIWNVHGIHPRTRFLCSNPNDGFPRLRSRTTQECNQAVDSSASRQPHRRRRRRRRRPRSVAPPNEAPVDMTAAIGLWRRRVAAARMVESDGDRHRAAWLRSLACLVVYARGTRRRAFKDDGGDAESRKKSSHSVISNCDEVRVFLLVYQRPRTSSNARTR
ncbi:uncharacterized protein J3D65DRAFT_96701 [Phyllosticta citribraziliensis]|uniref:Uncharacterized protein n=1 Tax=Phyllosticta citribraziliensis TaxID=989973 RepID=A0ABR1LAC0_9PEZI